MPYLAEERDLSLGVLREGGEQRRVVAQVLGRLLRQQLLLLVPLAAGHHALPDLTTTPTTKF